MQPWFLSLRWKTCLLQNCSLGSCACWKDLPLGILLWWWWKLLFLTFTVYLLYIFLNTFQDSIAFSIVLYPPVLILQNIQIRKWWDIRHCALSVSWARTSALLPWHWDAVLRRGKDDAAACWKLEPGPARSDLVDVPPGPLWSSSTA